MVRRCSAAVSPERVIETLASDAAQLRAWRPGSDTVSDAVRRLPPTFVAASPQRALAGSLDLRGEVVAAIPDDLKPAADEDGLEGAFHSYVQPMWDAFQQPINRYLAAKAFASWTAYQGRGLSTIVRGLEAALALVRIEASRQCRDAARALDRGLLLEAFRSADFALNHLAVGEELAAEWSRVEI